MERDKSIIARLDYVSCVQVLNSITSSLDDWDYTRVVTSAYIVATCHRILHIIECIRYEVNFVIII